MKARRSLVSRGQMTRVQLAEVKVGSLELRIARLESQSVNELSGGDK